MAPGSRGARKATRIRVTQMQDGDAAVTALGALYERFAGLLGDTPGGAGDWRGRLARLAEAPDDRLRVAVAGTVKSGKSTLVNALIGRDLLKRGAGIITSLVTRVRPGPELRAELLLKGWVQVNREATDAALFLGGGAAGEPVDLRREADRQRLRTALTELGTDTPGQGGFFDKNIALLDAYLQGYPAVRELLADGPRTLVFDAAEFERHREFAGNDALATYVDDLTLEIPGLPYPGEYEIGDCQGYDSPNPRHMERVQEYLLGAHLVVYVVSSRVGLREADLRFLRDIRALGLVGSTHFVLNVDLAEHGAPADLAGVAQRMAAELRGVTGEVPLYRFSALRSLLQSQAERGETLSRKEALLVELWQEAAVLDNGSDQFAEFSGFLSRELGEHRDERRLAARRSVLKRAAAALKSQLDAALLLAGEEAEVYASETQALREARRQVEASLTTLDVSIQGLLPTLRKQLFQRVDQVFHPRNGSLAEGVVKYAQDLRPPADALVAGDRSKLFRQMARIYQEMKAAFHRYKVEVVNPQAVDAIREIWRGVSAELAAAAAAPAELLIHNVEAYRQQAAALGIELPEQTLPNLDPSIGKRTLPLFSGVVHGGEDTVSDQVLGFAKQWSRKLAVGWARRLLRRGEGERLGFAESLLVDAAEAVANLLAENAHWALLNYNEQLKYQVLGKSLEEMGQAWSAANREVVETLVVDLDELAERVRRRGAERADLIPQLRAVAGEVESLLA